MLEELNYFKRPQETVPFYGELIGISYCDGSYRIARRDSDVTVLEYIESGSGVLQINEKRYYPQKGDVYLLPLHSDHVYYSDDKTPWIKYFINVLGDLPVALIRAYQLELQHVFHNSGTRDLFSELLDIAKRPITEFDRQELFAVKFHQILNRLKHSINAAEPDDDASLIKSIIDNAPNRIFSIQELADRMGRSRDYIIKTFERHYGITPHAYIIQLKMDAAKRLLTQTTLTPAEVARMLGYDDPAYFSRVFKARCGASPRTYRVKHTKLA